MRRHGVVVACVSSDARREGVVCFGIGEGRARQVHVFAREEGRTGWKALTRERPVTLSSDASTQDEDC